MLKKKDFERGYLRGDFLIKIADHIKKSSSLTGEFEIYIDPDKGSEKEYEVNLNIQWIVKKPG